VRERALFILRVRVYENPPSSANLGISVDSSSHRRLAPRKLQRQKTDSYSPSDPDSLLRCSSRRLGPKLH
ncbi:protein transport protein sec61 alpha, partial [Moniliophthora roreri]